MRGTALAFNRFLALLLSFLLGFLSFAGVLVGAGYVVYSQLSVDALNKLGMNIETEEFLDPNAEQPLTSMTLQKLVEEIKTLSEFSDELDLNALIERYGLKLDEETDKIIPQGIRTIPLSELFGPEGALVLLENIEVSYVLNLAPEGVITDPMIEALSDNTLKDIVDGDLAYLFDGVQLGFLVGVTYEKNESGEYEIIYEEEGNPSFVELIAPLDLGGVLASVAEDNLDLVNVIRDNFMDLEISALMKSFSGPDEEIPAFLEGKTLADIIKEDEDGVSSIDIKALLEGERVGTIMGYELKDITDDGIDNPVWVLKDTEDEADSITKALCDINLSDLLDEEADPMEVVMDALGDNTMGSLMGYELVDDVWQDSNGEAADSITASLCPIKLSELISDDADPMETIMDSLGTNTLGEIMGYELVDGKWVDEDGEPVDELFQAISGVLLEDLMDSDGENNAIVEAFGDSGTTLGGLMGYEYKDITPDDGEDNPVWATENDEEADALFAALCGVKLYDLMKDGADPSDEIMKALDGTTLGEIMGYELNESGVWVDSEGEPADALFAALCTVNLYHLMSPEDAGDPEITTASDVIMKAFEDSKTMLGDIMGYTKEQKTDEFGNPVYEKNEDGSLKLDDDGEPIPEYIWYDTDDETGESKEVTGVGAIFAGYLLHEVMDGGLDTEDIMSDLTIAKVYDLEMVDDIPVYLDGTLIDGFTFTVWFDGEKTASPIIGALAEYKVDELDEKIDLLKIADVIGLVEYGGKYYSWEVDAGRTRIDLELDDSLTAEFAGLTLKSFQGDAEPGEETIDSTIQKIKIYKVLGYTKNAEGKWEDKNGNEISGVMASIADSEVGNLTEDIDNLMIGEIAGYTEVGTNSDGSKIWQNDEGKSPSGIIGALADLTVKEMTDEDALSDKIQTVQVGILLGYELKEDGKWYDGNEEVKGVTGAIAGFTVEGLDAGINSLKIGKLLGYTETADGWLDESGNKVTGIMASVSGFTVDSLASDIETLQIGEIMGYYYNEADDNWYHKKDGNTYTDKVTGIMGAISGFTSGNLEGGINGISFGEVVGYELKEDGKWYSQENGAEATGIIKALADLTIEDLKNESILAEKLQKVDIGDIMGYTQKDGKWYTDSTCTTEVTGIMGVIAGTKSGNIETKIKDTELGELLSYQKVGGEWAKDDSGVELHVLMKKIAGYKLDEIGKITDELCLKDLFTEDDLSSGYLSLLNKDTKLPDLPFEINSIFTNTTMGTFEQKGIIENVPDIVKDKTIQEVINYIGTLAP